MGLSYSVDYVTNEASPQGFWLLACSVSYLGYCGEDLCPIPWPLCALFCSLACHTIGRTN